MRPRPDATENAGRGERRLRAAVASMRPRPDATENARSAAARRVPGPARASMRPRPDATENCGARVAKPGRPLRFNEAAARCHGKLPTARLAAAGNELQ